MFIFITEKQQALSMILYLFNPDTDLALANGKGNYTPSSAVSQMIQDLALLPIWYANLGSYVLTSRGEYNEFLHEQQKVFGLDVNQISLDRLVHFGEPIEIIPWGWNYSLRNLLHRSGFSSLPSDEELDERCRLSQRNVVKHVLEHFMHEQGFCGESYNINKVSDCEAFFEKSKGDGGMIVKAPWSSSGKGLLWCRDAFEDKDKNWCKRVIDSQGYVAVSPIYNKVQDFAMEFFIAKDSTVEFLGYSLFATDNRGAYTGNQLLSNQEIEEFLSQYVPIDHLEKAKQIVGNFLLHNGFKQFVGVDMMICREINGMCIHPCVEINYRQTMGMVARHLKDTFLVSDAHGKFMVEHFRSNEELTDFVNFSKQDSPLVVKQGRVQSGFMPLVPITSSTQNLAYIEVY